jgi:DNA-directed RNA polymerase specialized sigma24 family protein
LSSFRSSYSLEDVRRIVESYAELRARADTNARGLRTLVLLIDLERAMTWLPNRLRGVVLLHGLLGLDQETTANALQTSQRAISRRYAEGLEHLHFHMNGGYSF